MRLISKDMRIDPETFNIVTRLVIEVPNCLMYDGIALMGEDEVKQILGIELFDLLKEK